MKEVNVVFLWRRRQLDLPSPFEFPIEGLGAEVCVSQKVLRFMKPSHTLRESGQNGRFFLLIACKNPLTQEKPALAFDDHQNQAALLAS